MSPRPPELELLLKLDHVLQAFFRSPRRPRHGIFATDVEPDLSTIYVEFRFLREHTYCCPEPGCHIPRRFGRLISIAAEHSIQLPVDVVIRWHCIVEPNVYVQAHPTGVWTQASPLEFDYVSGGPGNIVPPSPVRVPSNFTGIWTSESPGSRTETQYVNGIKDGIFRAWDRNGVCLQEGFKKHGLWHGTLITRSSDGTILDSTEFDHGTGVYKIFNSNKQLTDEIPMRVGKPHGLARTWIGGRLVLTRHYVSGQCNAVNIEGSQKTAI